MKNMQTKIGLEIHGYLQTKEKLFCRCRASRHSAKQSLKPNSFICPICTGQPGSKPMLPNGEAIKKLIQIGLMLNCDINISPKMLVWNRKHYDWPDLPKGYQTTISGAFSIPVAKKGIFEGINITECHLEEDPAAWNPETGCIDYNRSGLALVEIVTEPDFKNSEQVVNWLNKLILTLSYIKAVDKNAGLKADVNISIEKTNFQRVEIKNLSSLESIKKAIEYEITRQENEQVTKETRRYDEAKNITIRMRGKEGQADYRFIPDPDLPVIKLTEKQVNEIKNNLPETPEKKLNKLIKQYKIEKKQADILTNNIELIELFEKVIEKIDAKFALPWITIEVLRVLNYNKKTLDEVEIKPEHIIELLKAVKDNKITELKAKQILNDFVPTSFSVSEKIKDSGKITNKKELEKIILQVIEKNSKAVAEYKSGKKESFNFLLGEIMKASERRADFQIAREILQELL